MDRTITMSELLKPEAIRISTTEGNKKQVLLDMAEQAATVIKIDAHLIFDVLWERERLGTTGIGNGIAIPHGRVEGLTTVQGFFARLTTPIDFEAVDNRPVDLVFLLLAPESAGADHLHALASVSRLLRNPQLCEALRHAKDTKAIYKLMTEAVILEAA